MPIGDLLPEITVLLTAVATLLAAMALPHGRQVLCAWLALAGVAVAAGLAVWKAGAVTLTFSGTFALDPATDWARLAILGTAALTILLSPRWFATDKRHGELYAMLLFCTLGAMAMAGAADLMQLMMGVLLNSITGYTLAGWHRDWAISLEAGMKYFLVGALANALMVTGIVLVLGMAGTTAYEELAGRAPDSYLELAGTVLVILGLLFKLAALPAHAWMPDVAEGAPVPVAAFLTTAPKIAGAIALYRLIDLYPLDDGGLRALIAAVAALTMTWGNLAALGQEDLRRMIGWSSVSQSGFALMAVTVAGRAPALPALLLFVTAYAAANIALLGAVTRLRGRTARSDYTGLARYRPWETAVLIVGFLSLVGVPPLGGFLGKFELFAVTIAGGMTWLAIVALANSALSLAVYLRFIAPAFFNSAEARPAVLSGTAAASMIFAALATVLLGLNGDLLPMEIGASP
ncbi:NADH-quinone oxidoreductase subunit L [Roseovarius sp. HI0049]|nr:NADH-quinone oxidoreductase subunit L [Roseovarius sp. HI0049]